MLLIAFGTASAVLVESGTPAFSMIGLASFLISSLAEAARVVGAEVLLGKSQRYASRAGRNCQNLACEDGTACASIALAWLLRAGPSLMPRAHLHVQVAWVEVQGWCPVVSATWVSLE